MVLPFLQWRAAWLPLPLVLLLLGDEYLSVIGKTDQFVTPLDVDNQIRVAVAVAVLKAHGDRGKVTPCAKQARADVALRFTWVSPRHFNHQDLPIEVDCDYVGFPPVSLRNLKGIEQKTAHNAS